MIIVHAFGGGVSPVLEMEGEVAVWHIHSDILRHLPTLLSRPRTTWMSQIVRDTGLTAADAWALADDRSTWRALRPTAVYAQQWVS